MKKVFLQILTIMTSVASVAQSQKEKQFMIIPCKAGTLFIDGTAIGNVEADDASKQVLSFGDHYLQLKTGNEKINFTLTIDENTKNIIKLGCTETAEIPGFRLVNKQLSLTGLLSNDMEENIIGLDKDDEIILNASVINKKGAASIFITEVNRRNEIYRRQDFRILTNEKIKIASKGVYKISLYTDALFGKDAKLTIDRVPSKNSSATFNTTPKRIYDTTYTEVLKTTARVYSTNNLNHSNRTTININLPANTTYWAYWIGVDQEARQKMNNLVEKLSPAARLISSNPLVLFGMKIIPSLPMMNSTATINYQFTDIENGRNFMNGNKYNYYTFKQANNISSDYALVKTKPASVVLAMWNESAFTGYDVEIRAVAFTVKSRLALQD